MHSDPAPVAVSVLIPVLNEERHLRDAVAAMQRQQFDGEVEFLFIDGRSEDRSREILEALARDDHRVKVLDNPARRTAAGLNVGLRAAQGRYVARMDAHAYYPERYLQRGVERLRRKDGVVWVTGPQIPEGDGPWSRRVALALTSWIGRGGESDKWPGAIDGDASDEFPLTTSVFTGVWERAYVDRIGGWDEGWPVNQDAEMAARVLAVGDKIICRPDMGAVYVPRDTLLGLGRQYGRYGYYRAKTYLRHPSSLPKSRWLPVGVVLTIMGSALPITLVRAPARLGLGAYLASLVVVSAKAKERAGRDAPLLPVVFLTMHISWGIGFILSLMQNVRNLSTLRQWPPPLGRAPERGDGHAVGDRRQSAPHMS